MGRAELAAIESGSTGEASGDMFFRLGMMYSTGADMPADYVIAHKWFNLAAARGKRYLETDASDDSNPILQRLGFVPVTTTTPYVWSPKR